MELDPNSLYEFKNFTEFMESGHANNGLSNTQLLYDLFIELGEQEYKKQNFLESASEFIETLDAKIDEEGNNKGLIPFQNECVFYLFEEGEKRMREFKRQIVSNPQLKKSCQDYLLKPFQEQNNAYNEYLFQLDNKYKKYKGIYLFYAFHQISAITGFTVTRHVHSNSTSATKAKNYNYLCCPSQAHYSINPKETILIFI